jgi:hypothetical protein
MDSAKVAEQLQSQVDSARKQIQAAVEGSTKKITELRHKAADAALHWVLAHDDRVKSFKRSVKNTPIEKAVDGLLKLLRSEARAGKPKRATKRRSPARAMKVKKR